MERHRPVIVGSPPPPDAQRLTPPTLVHWCGDERRGRRDCWLVSCSALDVSVGVTADVESVLGFFLAELREAASRVDPATAPVRTVEAAAWVVFCATPDAIEAALVGAPADELDAAMVARYEAGGYDEPGADVR